MTGGEDYEVPEGLRATVQHLELLGRKIRRLDAARVDAEEQVCTAIGRMWRSGEISQEELIDLWQAMPRGTGLGKRWEAGVGITAGAMSGLVQSRRHRLAMRPNGPNGTWVGEYPISGGSPCPPPGTSVVYILYDRNNSPIYVGSTSQFRTRMSGHWHTTGRRFVAWMAIPCADREAAYRLEDQLLKERMPASNRRRGR